MVNNDYLQIKKVAVLGAGVMGAQIAAHFANAGIDTLLFELPNKDSKDLNLHAKNAIKNLGKLKPTPFASKAIATQIKPRNYDEHLTQLNDCDLILEAVAERIDIKKSLYNTIAPHIGQQAILASNTSGISIAELSSVLPDSLQSRFCGIHFFNPPRYMKLVEIISAPNFSTEQANKLETFLVTILGKGVIHAKDTPNFIGNRIGVFSLLATIYHTEAFKLPFDLVDALTGPVIGRPKSATYRTADVVGLDTFANVVNTMANTLETDPWHQYFVTPTWMQQLIEQKHLGQKTRKGIYFKQGNAITVLNSDTAEYQTLQHKPAEIVANILKEKNLTQRFKLLKECDHPEAQFLWSIFRDLWHYTAVHFADIANNARDIDLAIRWGYGWQLGPLETWQAAGWQTVANWIKEDIEQSKTMSNTPLPDWVFTDNRDNVHSKDGSFSAKENNYHPRPALPVYNKQLFTTPLVGEQLANPEKAGTTIFETDFTRCWHQDDDIAIVSFKNKMHVIDLDIISDLNHALQQAEQHYKGLIIWHPAPPFSAGANLKMAYQALEKQQFEQVDELIKAFQDVNMAIKYSTVPVVAAVQGLALGGGCELMMHCTRTVAALESYIGLVEIGVGLLPAGGGLKELAIRAYQDAKGGDIQPHIQRYFQQVAQAQVSGSAMEAKELGYLKPSDLVVFNPDELLYVAKNQINALYAANYRQGMSNQSMQAAGKPAIAALKMVLVNYLEGTFISAYDYDIAGLIAEIICGGNVERNSIVDEQWLLDLERKHFLALTKQEKTQARIQHMLVNGKPLRN